jgi:hypothetical protein
MNHTQAETRQYDWGALAGLTGFLAGLTGTVAVALHQRWIEQHPFWVNGLYVFTGIAALVTFWRFFLARRSKKTASTDFQREVNASASGSGAVSQAVGRDNAGKMIGRVEHYHEAAPVQVPATPKPLEPTLAAKNPKKVYLDSSSRTIKLVEDPKEGLLSLLIPIENLAPNEDNGLAIEARNLVASLRFSREGVEFAAVSSAYWLGRQENRINLPVASSKDLVVGSYKTGKWFCYQNNRRDPFPERPTSQQIRNLASDDCEPAEAQHVYLNPHIDVEIKVLSVASEGTKLLLKRLYRLSQSQDPHDFSWQELS